MLHKTTGILIGFAIFVNFICGSSTPNRNRDRRAKRDMRDLVLDGVLDNSNRNFCVFGPITKNDEQNTFSFNSKLCVDADQRIYSCDCGLDLDFKKIWNCDNFVIQEQISGKCLQKVNGKYFLGSCNTCLNNTFFNLTDKCLKPSISDTIGTLLCDEITEATRKTVNKKKPISPLCKLMKIQKELRTEVEDIVLPIGLRSTIDRIDEEGKQFDKIVRPPKRELYSIPSCKKIRDYRRSLAEDERRRRNMHDNHGNRMHDPYGRQPY